MIVTHHIVGHVVEAIVLLLLLTVVTIVTSYWRTRSGRRLQSHSDDQNPHPENVLL